MEEDTAAGRGWRPGWRARRRVRVEKGEIPQSVSEPGTALSRPGQWSQPSVPL